MCCVDRLRSPVLSSPSTLVEAYRGYRPKAVIDDVFSVPSRLVQNLLKTYLIRLRLISSNIQLIVYTDLLRDNLSLLHSEKMCISRKSSGIQNII